MYEHISEVATRVASRLPLKGTWHTIDYEYPMPGTDRVQKGYYMHRNPDGTTVRLPKIVYRKMVKAMRFTDEQDASVLANHVLKEGVG